MRKFIVCVLAFLCVSTAQAANNTYAKTQYPIIMVGGAAAFDSFQLGFIKIDYWFGITDALRKAGADVYVTDLSGFSSNENRADELYGDILAIQAMTGADKVHLFAHSQGALAARMATQLLRETGHTDVVASVSTFAGMNRGTHISPWARERLEQIGVTPGSIGETLLDAIVGLVGILWEGNLFDGDDGDYNSDTRGWQSLLDLEAATHPDRVAEINVNYPDGLSTEDCMTAGTAGNAPRENQSFVNGVYYFSYGANSNTSSTSFAELFDPIYLGLALPLQQLVVNHYNNKFEWDGLVPQCGHKLGSFIGNWKMNHFDAVGHFAGLRPGFVNDLYLTQANRLKEMGL